MANGNDVATQTQSAGMDTLSAQTPPEVLQQQIPSMTQTPTSAPSNEEIPPYKPYTPPAQPESRPGGFGWKIAQALQGFTKAMGDAGNVGQVPEGGGALYGIAKTLQARNQRQREEQAHQDEQTQRAKENAREDWKTMAEVARANSQMRHEQFLTYQLGEQQMDKSISAGQQMVDQWSSLPKAQSEIKGENLTASELNSMIQSKKLDPTKVTAFPTGKKFITEDKNGNPQYAMTYTIMSVPAEYQLSPADKSWVDIVNKIPGANQYNVGTEGKNDGDRMPGYVANSLFKQSQTIQAQTAATIKAAADLKLTNEYNTFAPTGDWTMFLGAQKGDIADAEKHMLADPQMRQKYPNLHQDIVRSFATKEDPTGQSGYTTALDKQQKDREAAARDAERVRHDTEMERITEQNKKLQDASKNKYEGDPDLLEKYTQTQDPNDKIAYRKSFPLNEMSTIDSIGTGKAAVGSMSYLLSRNSNLADAVAFFYPDFDSSKVQGYTDIVKSANAGKDNIRLRSAGIASKHLWQLYRDTTLESRVPGTESAKERTSTFNQLATELAAFNAQSNAPGQKEIDDAKQTLGGNAFYSTNRQAALKQVASLMMDGLGEYKQRWKNAAPSPAYESKFPDMSPESYASLALVANDGKVKVKDSQGRVYSFDQVEPLAKYLQAKMVLEKGAR